jgi:tetratricopeptide (TPR) repeat protein
MHCSALVILSLCISASLFGQGAVTQEERNKANAYFNNSDWANAAKDFKSIADREPSNANARMKLGQALSALGKNKEAIPPLEESIKIGNSFIAMYALANVYGKLNDNDKTFEWLDKSLTAGFSQRITFTNSQNFGAFKNDARYKVISDRLDRAVNPCHYAPESRQFDFWIGEWDANNLAGALAGKSSIQLMLGECIIYENWTSALPNEYSGKSFNFYDAATKKWKQTWVDDKGGILEFIDGVYADNKMTFVTLPNAQNQITKLTFHNLDPNTVRQVFETTADDGKTWTTTTDLLYHRTK